MLKFSAPAKNGNTMIGLGLEAGNIERLQKGEPMYFSLEPLGIEGVEIMIMYGDTKDDIRQKLLEAGLATEDVS